MTETFSESVTWTWIVSPALYAPFAVLEETFVTVGAVVSTTIAFWPPIEFAPPTAGRVSVALFVAASSIVPPDSASEFVAE